MNVILVILSIFFAVNNGAKIRKLIDFLDKDAPKDIEKVPNYNEESIAFRRDKNFNPCRENPNLCANNGKCGHQDGNFYCICPVTHYGKTCEHIADQTHCDGHFCQNNATCVSRGERRKIVNTVRLAELRTAKGVGVPLTDAELSSVDVEVQYECICRRGTFGTLCDESEDDRVCQEVFCLGRGKGWRATDGTCRCECEKQFFGQRCEQLSACFDTQCENGGICEDVVDLQAKTVTATCKCPTNVEIIDGKVSGENCERLDVPPQTLKELIPCEPGRDSFTFFKKLAGKIDLNYLEDINELDAIREDFHDGNPTDRMTDGWCKNEGKCVPEVVRVQSSHSYLIHRCECTDPLTDGYYCEFKKGDACSLSRNELARGAKWDEKCTDMAHGACVDINGVAQCVCKPDFTGETCEVFDPCARHPCKHGDCIPTPTSADASFGTSSFQCLCPLSSKLSESNECLSLTSKSCPPDTCGHGRCVPCDSEGVDDDVLELCDEQQKKQGFRCLCEAGFLPPLCRVHSNPCHHNLCRNSATCHVDDVHKSYDCLCLNGTSGSLCETIDDYCDAFGNDVCRNGICINDEYFHRGFSCQCDDGFEGINCDVALSGSEILYRRVMTHYHLTVPLSACLLTLLFLLFIICTSRLQTHHQKAPESNNV